MPTFRHEPSGDIIEAHNAAQSARYRRSHRFTELPDSLPVSSSSPQSPRQSPSTPPDTTPESHETHRIAPHATEPTFDDLTTTTIKTMTVSQVLQLVGTDPDRAARILKLEQAGRNRVTLTSKLRRIR